MDVKFRSFVLLIPLLLNTGQGATASEGVVPDEAAVPTFGAVAPSAEVATKGAVAPLPEAVVPLPEAVVPPEAGGRPLPAAPAVEPPRMHEVFWTVDSDRSIAWVARAWGLRRRDLERLNPQLSREARVAAGTSLRVYERNEQVPTQSIGSPSDGRLRHGLPMPEGPYWKLRTRRKRAFGTHNAIHAMLAAFQRYGESFDDPPQVLVGELSYRRGGQALPHRSHRTGRDVDLGYILTAAAQRSYWRPANRHNFDVEKNWALIKALVDTGEVEHIFISSQLQRLLRPVARRELTAEEFARYFPRRGNRRGRATILMHCEGHVDHMHVRFRCEDGNKRCRSGSIGRV